LNTIGCYGLRAALDLVLEVGVENMAAAVQGLADRLAEGLHSKGYETLGSRTPETGAGIVSFRREGTEAAQIVRRLKDRKIIAAPRQGWVRMSPHFYISPDEIDRTVAEL
jgi:selenocysteine lyase/cysteine desulfurase